jgi:hypothetical protein
MPDSLYRVQRLDRAGLWHTVAETVLPQQATLWLRRRVRLSLDAMAALRVALPDGRFLSAMEWLEQHPKTSGTEK